MKRHGKPQANCHLFHQLHANYKKIKIFEDGFEMRSVLMSRGNFATKVFTIITIYVFR